MKLREELIGKTLELVAVREVVITGISRGRVGGLSSGRNGGCRKVASRRRRHLDLIGDAENLANVDVCAVRVDLGIILVKDGGVGLEVRRNLFAGIVLNDDIGCRAILASVPEAESGSWYEVGAGWVDRARVNGGKLVGRDVVSRGNAIANISILDGV